MSDFWSDPSSTSIFHVYEPPERSLVAYVISTVSHELAQISLVECSKDRRLTKRLSNAVVLTCCEVPVNFLAVIFNAAISPEI